MDECECTWRIAGESGGSDAVGAALSRRHATLWYGSHCLAYSRMHDEAGNLVLQLQAVGHRLPADFEAPILMLSDDGDATQQLIAPGNEGEGTEVIQRLGRALFAEVARAFDFEAQCP